MSSAQTNNSPEEHLTPAQIVAFRDGELTSASAHQHLLSCPRCQTQIAEAYHLGALLRRIFLNNSSQDHPFYV